MRGWVSATWGGRWRRRGRCLSIGRCWSARIERRSCRRWRDWPRGSPRPDGGRARSAGKTAFVFPGQGAQWLGMGSQLVRPVPGIRTRFRRGRRGGGRPPAVAPARRDVGKRRKAVGQHRICPARVVRDRACVGGVVAALGCRPGCGDGSFGGRGHRGPPGGGVVAGRRGQGGGGAGPVDGRAARRRGDDCGGRRRGRSGLVADRRGGDRGGQRPGCGGDLGCGRSGQRDRPNRWRTRARGCIGWRSRTRFTHR